MRTPVRHGARLLVPTLIIVLVLAVIAVWALQQPSVSAGSPPPDYPAFEGEPFTAKFTQPELLDNEPIAPAAVQAEWTAVLSETFEAGLNSFIWESLDLDGPTNGEYKWGTEVVAGAPDPASTRSAWAIGDGEDGGKLDVTVDGYPNNVMSWLVAGPFDMRNVTESVLSFSYALDADAGDIFGVGVSTDRVTFNGIQANDGGVGGWAAAAYDLSAYNGEPLVWIAFIFTSDDVDNSAAKAGALLDDVQLAVRPLLNVNLPIVIRQPPPTPTNTPTPPPTPTATPVPGGDYIDNFTSDIDGWDVRRYSDGTNWELIHRGDSDGGRSGFLQLLIETGDDYALVSPLVEGPEPPYNIEFDAQFKDEEDRQMYGVIFGGDWDGRACPDNNGFDTCFTEYYELRIQYRSNSGNPFLEFKLKRIDSHNSDNQPVGPTLIDWTRVNVNPTGWTEWDVTVEADGDIFISAEDRAIARVRDTTYLDRAYFGLEVITKENEDARVKFDYFKINSID